MYLAQVKATRNCNREIAWSMCQFQERQKQDVFAGASMEGFTAIWKLAHRSGSSR
jgi:hypothetical protein